MIAAGCGGDTSEVEEGEDSTCESLQMGTIELENEIAADANLSQVDYAIDANEGKIRFAPKDYDQEQLGEVLFWGQEPEDGEPMSLRLAYDPKEGNEVAVEVELGVLPANPTVTTALPPQLYLTGTVTSDGQTVGFTMTGHLNDGDPSDVDEENPILDAHDAVFFVDDGHARTTLDVVVDGEPRASEEELQNWVDDEVGSEWFDDEAAAVMVGAVFDDNVVNRFQEIEAACRAAKRGSTVDQSHQTLSACEVAQAYQEASEIAEGAGEFFVGTILIPIGGAELAIGALQRDVEAGDIIGTIVGAHLGVAIAAVGYSTGLALAPLVLALGGGLLLGSVVLQGGAAIAASTCGNPLVSALNGTAFPFRQRGEFIWYTRSTNENWQMQIRLSPHPESECPDGTGIEATAIAAGEDRVAFYADRDKPLWINGEAQNPRDYYWRLDDRTQIERQTVTEGSEEIYFVTSPAGERLRVDIFGDRLDLEMDVPEELRSGVRGIIGAPSEEGVQGLELRDGTVLEEPVATRDLYGEFGTSWQISPEESLFDYEVGEGPEDYRSTGEIPAPRRLEDLDEEQLAYAEYVCDQVGQVSDPTLRHHCMLDVGCTGDASYMTTYRRISPPKRNLELVDEAGNPVVGMADERRASSVWRPDIGAPGGPTGEFAGSTEIESIQQGVGDSCPTDIENAAESVGTSQIRTMDGLAYDFQAAGEFVLVESKTDDPMMIQVRQQPEGGGACPDARVNTAVAAQMGDSTVAFYVHHDYPILINGEPFDINTWFSALDGGHTVSVIDYDDDMLAYLLQWPDGSWLHVEHRGDEHRLDIRFNSHYTRMGQIQGLFGQFNGYPDNDIALRNGQVLNDRSTESIHGEFADSWRISQEESLFDYSDGETTEDFTLSGVPSEVMTVDDVPTADRDAAQARCEDEAIDDPGVMQACIIDYYCAGEDEDKAIELAQSHGDREAPVEVIDHDGEPVDFDEDPDDPPVVEGDLPAISAGGSVSCMLDEDGYAQCWGWDGVAETAIPDDEQFVAISTAGDVCAVDTSGDVMCWDESFGDVEMTTPPISGTFMNVHVGGIFDRCALDTDGYAHCWGGFPEVLEPPEDTVFTELSVGSGHACGLREDGTVECWGEDDHNQSSPPEDEVFVEIDAISRSSCGLKEDGTVECWSTVLGHEQYVDSVEGMSTISIGANVACGLLEDGTVDCWGDQDDTESGVVGSLWDTPPPEGSFTHINLGGNYGCVMDDDLNIECWGMDNQHGSSPP